MLAIQSLLCNPNLAYLLLALQVIKRLWRLKEAVGFVEMESGQIIWDLILNLFAHQNFITNSFVRLIIIPFRYQIKINNTFIYSFLVACL